MVIQYRPLKKSEVPESKQKMTGLEKELNRKNEEIKKLTKTIKSLEEEINDAKSLLYVDARDLKTLLVNYATNIELGTDNKVKAVVNTKIRKNIQRYSSGRIGKDEINQLLYGLDAGKSRLYKEMGNDFYTPLGMEVASKLIRFLEGREEILKKTIEGKASWFDRIKIYLRI